jgi:hypothetical protein
MDVGGSHGISCPCRNARMGGLLVSFFIYLI